MIDRIIRQLASAQRNAVASSRHGLVSAVDPINHAVKVRLQPEDIETGWLQYGAGVRSGDLRIGCPPSIGQHVAVSPMEGDPEHLLVSSDVFDDIVRAPLSPVTGKPAQSGEKLVRAGCGAPPTEVDGRGAGSAADNGAWYHITKGAFYAGAGSARLTITDGSVIITVGGASFTFDEESLSAVSAKIVSDTDVLAGNISLKSHTHLENGKGSMTDAPQ